MAISATDRIPGFQFEPQNRGADEVKRLANFFNAQFGLQLISRDVPETPSQRKEDIKKVCFDVLQICYYNKDPEILRNRWHNFSCSVARAKPLNVQTLHELFLDIFSGLIEGRAANARPAIVKEAGNLSSNTTPFTQRLTESNATNNAREPTPEAPEDDEMQPPASPSPTARRPRGIKRHSNSADTSPAKQSRTSTNSRFARPDRYDPLETKALHTSFRTDTTAESEARTEIFDRPAQGALNVSFETDRTSVDGYPSHGNDIEYPRITPPKPKFVGQQNQGQVWTDQSTRKEENIDRWIQEIPSFSESLMSSYVPSSPVTKQNDEVFHDARQSPMAQKTTPTQALSQMRLVESPVTPSTRHSKSKPPLECHQIKNLAQSRPLGPTLQGIDATIDFRILWEAHRYAKIANCLVNEFLPQLRGLSPGPQVTVCLENILRQKGLANKMPSKSSATAWSSKATSRLHPKVRFMFSKSNKADLFDAHLLPLACEKPCRFQRKYGSDRLLYIEVPNLEKVENRFHGKENLPTRFLDWLCTTHDFVGRKYEALYAEPLKAKAKDTERFGGHRVVLFATHGPDLDTVTIEAAVRWFMPLPHLRKARFRKTFSRIGLGLSKTEATIVFKPSQVFEGADIIANGEDEPTEFNDHTLDWTEAYSTEHPSDAREMTNGCGLISTAAMKLIFDSVGHVGPIPTAVQGRINGCKGLWIRFDGPPPDESDKTVWIMVRNSQRKFPRHSEDTEADFDQSRWTFELLNASYDKEHDQLVGSLHMDFIPLANAGGVPTEAMQNLVGTALRDDGEDLLNALTDRGLSLHWLGAHDGSGDSEDATDGGEDLPLNFKQKAILMLNKGFMPLEHHYLGNTMLKVAQMFLVDQIQKLRVDLPESVTLFAVPDPYGCLKPGEVHIKFAHPMLDRYDLDEADVLLFRHPMLIQSDVQKVRAVCKRELDKYVNVLVLPTCGKLSTMYKLQGGDMDGDKVTIVWNKDIVEPFCNAPVLPPKYKPSDFGIRKDSRTVAEVLTGTSPERNFLREGFKARLQPVPLGMVHNALSKIVYATWPHAYHNEATRKLQELYTMLIDADKNGHEFTDAEFRYWLNNDPDVRALLDAHRLHGRPDQLSKAEYITVVEKIVEKGVKALKDSKKSSSEHPNDLVFFQGIAPQVENFLERLGARIEEARAHVDPRLTAYYDRFANADDVAIKTEIRRLHDRLDTLRREWGASHVEARRKQEEHKQDADTGALIDRYRRKYSDISPQNPELQREWLRTDPLCHQPTMWDLIKASTLYKVIPPDKSDAIVFQLAAYSICYIKATQHGGEMYTNNVMSYYRIKKPKPRNVWTVGEPEDRTGGVEVEPDEDAGSDADEWRTAYQEPLDD